MKAVFRSTFVIIIAVVLLKSLGFVREMSLAAVYGAGVTTDAFVIAYTVPAVVLAFVSAAVGSVYIPLYQDNRERGGLFTSNVINLAAITGLAFAVIFSVFPQALVFLFASQIDDATFSQAVTLTRIMAWTAVPVLLANVFKGYLEINNAFFTSHISYAVVNTCIIASVFLSGMTDNILLLGFGAVAGHLLYIFIMIMSGRRHGLRHSAYLNLRDDSIKEMLALSVPVIVATGLSEINQIVDRNFASTLTSGAISSLSYSTRIISLATTLMGTAAATVLFPKLSQFAAEDNHESIKRYLSGSIKMLVPIVLPLAAGAVILAHPLIRILFERGAFTAADTQRTAQCLQMYAVCIVFVSLNALLLKACHAMKDTKGPAIGSAIAMAVNVALNFVLIAPLQHMGLALSTGLASVVTSVLLFIVLHRKIGALGLRSQVSELVKIVGATVIMAAAVRAGYCFLPVMSGGTAQCVLLTGGLVLAGALIYIFLNAILRTGFLRDSIAMIRETVKDAVSGGR